MFIIIGAHNIVPYNCTTSGLYVNNQTLITEVIIAKATLCKHNILLPQQFFGESLCCLLSSFSASVWEGCWYIE